jgi:hypothetical protein
LRQDQDLREQEQHEVNAIVPDGQPKCSKREQKPDVYLKDYLMVERVSGAEDI